jgi:hypothetical protein
MAVKQTSVPQGARLDTCSLSSARTNLSQDEEKYIDGKGVNWEKNAIEREDTNLTLPSYKRGESLPVYVDEDGSEVYNTPVSTAKDLVTEVIHARDDPTLNPWTFRVWFLGSFSQKDPHTRRLRRQS